MLIIKVGFDTPLVLLLLLLLVIVLLLLLLLLLWKCEIHLIEKYWKDYNIQYNNNLKIFQFFIYGNIKSNTKLKIY